MAFAPEIITHEIATGSVFDGALTNGALDTVTPPTNAPYFNGRAQFYGGGTSGGRIVAFEQVGMAVGQIMFRGPGTTAFTLELEIDSYPAAAPVSFSHMLFDESSLRDIQGLALADVTSFVFCPVRPIFIPPGGSLVFKTTGALSSAGRVTFVVGNGWGVRTFQQG